MPSTAQAAVGQLMGLLTQESGLSQSVASLTAGADEISQGLRVDQVFLQQVSNDLDEKTGRVRYPVFHVYCSRIENKLTQKFQRFSGSADVVIEIRVSQDRLEGLTERVHVYADAVADVIERNRGCLAEGFYLPGTYEVKFGAIRRGGQNYLQSAQIETSLEISR